MRVTSVRLAFLFCAALFLLGPAAAFTQQPGGGRGKGKGGGGDNTQPGGTKGGSNLDVTQLAQQMFDRLANGKDEIVIADLPAQGSFNGKATMQAWATAKGITNGKITRDQYTEYVKERLTQAQQGGGGTQPRDYDKEAEASFRRFDKEGTGKLTPDDMPAALRDELEKWDTNKDGAIDLNEYKAYYKARMAFLNPGQDPKPGVKVEEKASVEVYRLKNVEPNDALDALNVLVGNPVAPRRARANPDDPILPGNTVPPRAGRGGAGGIAGPGGFAPSGSLAESRLAAAGITCRGLADLRTRSLVVRGTAKDQQLAADLVAILDTPDGKSLPKLKVVHAFRLENIDGTDLVAMLQMLDPNMTYRLTPVPKTKLLLATGTDDQMKELADSVKKLDVPADIK